MLSSFNNLFQPHIYSFLIFFAFKPNPLTKPIKMKKRAMCKCAFALALATPSLKEVFKNKCTTVAPIQAVIMGDCIPLAMGSNPLFMGKNAPPHPEIVPAMMGPKTGNENRDGAIAALAAVVNVITTFALTHS